MKVIFQKIIKRKDLTTNPDMYFLFGDNCKRVGLGGQAGEMRGEPNAIGIATKFSPGGAKDDFFTDEKLEDIKEIIDSDLRKVPRGNVTIVIPKDGLGTGLSELPKRAPKVYKYLCEQLKKFESMPDVVRGWKAMDKGMTCRSFKFEVGKEYKHEGSVVICQSGFHFCESAADVFEYYGFKKGTILCEVEARGIVKNDGGDKSVTDVIYISRAYTSWDKILERVNTGTGNAGRGNSGDRNSGYLNSGDLNSGYRNSGDLNSGDRNSGDLNSGDLNSGDRNSGDLNSGDRNSGDRNSGDLNSGDRNSGDLNSGDCNATNNSSGVFNNVEAKILMFNKPSDWTYKDWRNSEACSIISNYFENNNWISDSKIQPQEGKLEILEYKKAWSNMWAKLNDKQKEVIMQLPNFDKKVFKEITGIKI